MTMHIERAVVTNFKRIKGVDITMSGDEVVLSGKNFQGKSSFIDAIWNTLAGKQSVVTMPIREGESKASSVITLTDPTDGSGYVVTRTWKGNSSKLTVRAKGSKADLNPPQDILNGLIGKFAFDPMSFTMMSTAKQRDTLMGLVGIDLAEHDAKRDATYKERTVLGREVTRAKGALESMEEPAGNVPTSPVSVNDLLGELRSAEDSQERVRHIRVKYTDVQDTIATLREKLSHAEQRLVELAHEGRTADAAAIDPEPIRAKLSRVEELNSAFHEAEQYRTREADVEGLVEVYEKLTASIKVMDEHKAAVLASAKLPIDQLSFDDKGVLYKGVPLSQSSAAELREVSFAMAIAMDPELRVCCIKDASLFDEESLAHIRELAERNDFQLVLELVGDYEGATAIFEDGEVK